MNKEKADYFFKSEITNIMKLQFYFNFSFSITKKSLIIKKLMATSLMTFRFRDNEMSTDLFVDCDGGLRHRYKVRSFQRFRSKHNFATRCWRSGIPLLLIFELQNSLYVNACNLSYPRIQLTLTPS